MKRSSNSKVKKCILGTAFIMKLGSWKIKLQGVQSTLFIMTSNIGTTKLYTYCRVVNSLKVNMRISMHLQSLDHKRNFQLKSEEKLIRDGNLPTTFLLANCIWDFSIWLIMQTIQDSIRFSMDLPVPPYLTLVFSHTPQDISSTNNWKKN